MTVGIAVILFFSNTALTKRWLKDSFIGMVLLLLAEGTID